MSCAISGIAPGSQLYPVALAAHQTLVEIHKSPAQDALERDIAAILNRSYEREFGRPASDVIEATLGLIRTDTVSQRDLSGVLGKWQLMGEGIDLTGDEREELASASEEGYRIERGAVARQLSIDVIWNLTDQRAVDWLGKETPFWIGRHYDQQMSRTIRSVVRSVGLEAGLGVGETARQLEAVLGGVHTRSRAYWNLLATNGITRGRNFGGIESFVQGRVSTIRYTAVMDGRTSEICRALDGRIFQVSDAAAQRDAVISSTPDGLRANAPWATVAVVEALAGPTPSDNAGLVAAGIITPPVHGNCRSFLVASR